MREKEALLLDAGDLFFKKFAGPHPESEREELAERAHLILKSFEQMGYDAIGIGDDDFSLGKKFLVDLSKKSKIPFLSSNVVDQNSNQLLFQRYLIKEVNGLRIGIFALLDSETFIKGSDPRKDGLIFRDPAEIAQEIIRELQSKTDFIILLSHLGYQRDVELASRTYGIHMIVGGHTGVHLTNPPVIKNTIILQSASKGWYGQRLNLLFSNRETTFYNRATKAQYERNLTQNRQRLRSANISEAEKRQWQEAVNNIENFLKQLEERNPFTVSFFPLAEAVKEDPDIRRWVEDHKSRFPEKVEPRIHDSRPPSPSKP